jgi:hypothetical protein
MTDISKNDLKKVFALLDKWPMFENMGKTSAYCDMNGIVHITDGNDNIRIQMSYKDYQDMLEYGKEKQS